jgi:hypothetical protein
LKVGDPVANHIFLSATSLQKVMGQMEVEYSEELPIIGKVSISPKEIRFGVGRIGIPVHTNVPLAKSVDFELTEFQCTGTVVSLRVSQVGFITSWPTSILGSVVAALLGKGLRRTSVRINGNQVTADFSSQLPSKLQGVNVTSLTIRDGIDITFDY